MSTALDFVAPLFVPADRPERIEKAAVSGADAIIIDLEDAVSADARSSARSNLRADFAGLPVVIRINAIGTQWHAGDIEATTLHPFAALMVPKAHPDDDLRSLCAGSRLPVIPLVETARGIAGARQMSEFPNVARLAFGSIDYCADIGCNHVRDALLTARSELVLASRLAGLAAPIDGVTASLEDVHEVEQDALYAAGLGFGGKLAIHPRQIAPILAGFAPSENDVIWATRVLASGEGATAVDGAMVDAPVRARARLILRRRATIG